VEQLTHSQQTLDGSLAIKPMFGPQAHYLNPLQSYTINPERAELGSAIRKAKTCVEQGKLLQQLVKAKQHQWPEV